MRIMFGLLVLTAGTLGWLSESAKAEGPVIECPVKEVTGTVTERLPSGWTVAPSGLTDTRVAEREGHDGLQCVYGNGIAIEATAKCIAQEGGFRCETRQPN